jgi:imidazolonepropionase-like amidohydrolase
MFKKMRIIVLLICALVSVSVVAQKQGSVLLINGYLHIGNGEVIESAFIGIREGKIAELKNSLATTYSREDWDTIVDLMGKHVYPAFIAPNSTLGLTEVDAVRATRDFNEVGQYNPHIRSQIAFNVESKVISTVRTNGVLMAQATPRGGDISGTSSIMMLNGWNWEDATVFKDDGVHVNWPSSLEGGGWWAEPEPKKRNEKYEEQKRELSDFFDLAKAYANSDRSKKDLRLEAMIDCFKGKKRVYIHADELQQLLDVIDFAKKYDLSFPVIVGGYDSHLIGRRLKDAKIPVMVGRTHSLPQNEDDPIDLPFRLPALLQEQGIPFCLQNTGDMEAMNTRNLPFQAGTAMAYGLTEEQAVRSISLSAAEILGIDKEFGSVEIGKSATLFVSEGNALDMRTNNLTHALVRGKFISLDNFQKGLYELYQEKLKENR